MQVPMNMQQPHELPCQMRNIGLNRTKLNLIYVKRSKIYFLLSINLKLVGEGLLHISISMKAAFLCR